VRIREVLREARTRRPVAFEVGTGIAAGVLVLVVSLTQWGTDWDSLFRGLSLGAWLGVVVWFATRRRRVEEERATRAVGEQRLQLARELHDTVAGQVSVIGIQAAAARRVLTSRPDDAAVALERIESAARAANADLRRMLDALRSGDPAVGPAAEPGLGALEELVAGTPGGQGRVALTIEPGTLPVSDVAVDRAAYRIVQEALTNVGRHAGDVPISVDVRRDGGVLVLTVINGPGAAGSQGASGRGEGAGLGLVGVRERAALLGGSADGRATPDGGFAVHARLPLRGRS
jgi:signal transduction histidine kinase